MQLSKSAALVRDRHPAFTRVPADRPLLGLVVTMEPFYTVNTPFTPQAACDDGTCRRIGGRAQQEAGGYSRAGGRGPGAHAAAPTDHLATVPNVCRKWSLPWEAGQVMTDSVACLLDGCSAN